MMKYFLLFFSFLLSLPASTAQKDITDQLKKPIPYLPQSTPNAVGLSQDSIRLLVQQIKDQKKYDMRGLVVIKDDQLVVEEYFNTYWRATLHDIRSAGKSITAILMGIAINKGLIRDVEQPVYEFFQDIPGTVLPTEKHRQIKIKHLLMMSSGLDADFNDLNSTGHVLHWIAEDDWIKSALSLPMKFEPGSQYVYNDVCAMLTGAIIQKVAGQTLEAFAKAHLFDPLDIKDFYWYTTPGGITAGMGNLYLTNLDFAKIGWLLLNKGNWQGQQIVAEDWVVEMSKKRIDISELDPFSNYYGYFWYTAQSTINNQQYEYFLASGNGGNKLYVIPQENMVISIQSSAYGKGYGHFRSKYILEAILRSGQ